MLTTCSPISADGRSPARRFVRTICSGLCVSEVRDIGSSGAATCGREDRDVTAYESVSTWKQPPTPPGSETRVRVIDEVAGRVCATGSGRLRVVVDGLTGAGKTTFAGELAAAVRLREVVRRYARRWTTSSIHGGVRERRAMTA